MNPVTWGEKAHELFIHQWGIHRWTGLKWFIHGGGIITHYKSVDGKVHRALFCDVCGRIFDKDKPAMIGTLQESLVEDYQLDNLCLRMTANKYGRVWPLPANAGAAIERELLACKVRNG